MYTLSSHKDGHETYMMLRITRKEALDLIQSLAAQLENDSPNVGRSEPRFITADQKDGGRFSIYVQDPFVCDFCHADIEPCMGTKWANGVICKKCTETKCPTCNHIEGHQPSCYTE